MRGAQPHDVGHRLPNGFRSNDLRETDTVENFSFLAVYIFFKG
jgi:hypothetical protein